MLTRKLHVSYVGPSYPQLEPELIMNTHNVMEPAAGRGESE